MRSSDNNKTCHGCIVTISNVWIVPGKLGARTLDFGQYFIVIYRYELQHPDTTSCETGGGTKPRMGLDLNCVLSQLSGDRWRGHGGPRYDRLTAVSSTHYCWAPSYQPRAILGGSLPFPCLVYILMITLKEQDLDLCSDKLIYFPHKRLACVARCDVLPVVLWAVWPTAVD